MEIRRTKDFKRFVESCPSVDSKTNLLLENNIKNLLKEKKPVGRFEDEIEGKGFKVIFVFYLSKVLGLLFGIGGYLKRRGEPRPALLINMSRTVREIQTIEKIEEGKHEKGGQNQT